MVESIPTLEWKRKKGTMIWEAKLPGGVLCILPQVGGQALWFYEQSTRDFHLGTFPTLVDAKDYANVWVGDNTTATG